MDLLTHIRTELTEMPRKLAHSARYALDNPDKIALQSMRSSASEAGVTSTTMLRLARHLGYNNYEAFRASFQDHLVAHGFGSRAKKLQRARSAPSDTPLADQIFDAAIDNLEQARSENAHERLVAAARQIRQARGVYLIGSGSAFVIASLMKTTGTMALPNLRLVGAEFATAPEGMAWLGPGDVALAIGVSPYAARTIEGLAFAREVGAGTVVITDRPSSPLAEHGDYNFFCGTESPHYFPSAVAIVAVVEVLLATAVAEGGGTELEQIRRIEADRDQSDAYRPTGLPPR